MKTIEVYDPPMCCSTGVCGPDVDPVLPWFAGVLSRLSRHGVRVDRYNLAHQPLAFVRNSAVKALLDQDGTHALPAIFVDGALVHHASYPDRAMTDGWLVAASAISTVP